MGRRRATRRRKWAAQSVCSRPSGLGSERCAPEAASAATSWGSRQHGAVGAGEAPGPGRASGAGGVASEARALTARLSPLQSRHQKRARAQAQLRNLEAYAAQPHSFVFTRGRAGRSVQQLSLDVRRVMEPLTATRLQVCTPRPPALRAPIPGLAAAARNPGEVLGPGVRGSIQGQSACLPLGGPGCVPSPAGSRHDEVQPKSQRSGREGRLTLTLCVKNKGPGSRGGAQSRADSPAEGACSLARGQSSRPT